MVSKMYTADDIIKLLAAQGYFANRKIAYSVLNALQPDSAPLLIEETLASEKQALQKL